VKILLLANNKVGWQVSDWLKKQGEEIVGLVLHPFKKRKYGSEIIKSTDLPQSSVFDATVLKEKSVLSKLSKLNADIAISILFDYILRDDFIALFKKGVINLHPSYLPYNRGQYPNVWSIIEGTPSGVTLHYIDAGIDTGDIIAQKEVPVLDLDTGETLYKKLEKACLSLFVETWPLISHNKAPRISQLNGTGTYHQTRDVDKIDRIDLEKKYTGRELINILRARTFPPYKGAYFQKGKQKIYLRLQLSAEEEQAN
jgi:methionyl-tRNA formyltransferase